MENIKEQQHGSGEDLLLRVGLNDNKAGMEGLDKEKINRIIMEATKGSRFYGNELKKEKQVNQRIEKMMQQKAQITNQQLRKAQLQVDRFAMELEQSRNLSNTMVHVDMDAFYAAVEMRDNPELKDKPIAVGSMSMLSTSNYHARRFGVRAAMPGFIAKRLCPQLIIVPPNFDKYRAVSEEVKEILADYDPDFMAVSLDEAYLNITKHLVERQSWPEDKRRYFTKMGNPAENATAGKEADTLGERDRAISPLLFEDSPPDVPPLESPFHGNSEEQSGPQVLHNPVVFGTSAEEVVKEIRFRIEQKTGLTASAGIAPNTMLAKICSDKNKPNGQYQVLPTRQAVMNFIKDLPIRKVSGIGKVTEKMLKALGVVTCAELYQQRALLSLLFSETSWHYFLHISLGLGSTHLARDGERKSMSVERTFSEISQAEEQYSLCQELCRDLAQDLQKEGLKGRTITIKLKNVDFEVKTRACTVPCPISTAEEIFAVAKELLRTEIDADFPRPLRLRLMGVRVSGFPSEEDRKQQQRSIVGFLQAGHQVPPATGPAPEGMGTDLLPKPPETTLKKKSFFDKKRLERKEGHQDALKCDGTDEQNLQTSHTVQVLKRTMNENLVSENLPSLGTFTCPVCCQEQGGVSLEAFNRHVDTCLEAPSGREASRVWLGSGAAAAEVSNKENAHCFFSCGEKQDDQAPPKSAGLATGGPVGLSSEAQSAGTSSPNHSKEDHTDLPEHSYHNSAWEGQGASLFGEQECPQPDVCEVTAGRALVCPVCNQEQKTPDLTLFNVHVDICLNKDVIHELRNNQDNLVPQLKENSRSSETSLSRVRKTSAKTKRPTLMKTHSASKKAKPSNTTQTIDTFFK
ncbi:DNA polymerase kappa isoform X1 [Ochotona princeps]|uniref:DNA polymerase kappa isoform X1 n=1 Tax=Ochotona princeps TaxID=9978 RepID=UPI002714B732|nr:DNA polymerase kappa isoform X1 [Ochotona princeps]XP_058512359.1 DNA polymerase kappa isoform X1 [Ochotona princeps]